MIPRHDIISWTMEAYGNRLMVCVDNYFQSIGRDGPEWPEIGRFDGVGFCWDGWLYIYRIAPQTGVEQEMWMSELESPEDEKGLRESLMEIVRSTIEIYCGQVGADPPDWNALGYVKPFFGGRGDPAKGYNVVGLTPPDGDEFNLLWEDAP